MPTLEAIPTRPPRSSAEPRRVFQLSPSNSAGDLPFGSLVMNLTPGLIDIVNEKGELVARMEKFLTTEQENLVKSIEELMTPEDRENIKRQIAEPGPTTTYAEIRKRIFGEV